MAEQHDLNQRLNDRIHQLKEQLLRQVGLTEKAEDSLKKATTWTEIPDDGECLPKGTPYGRYQAGEWDILHNLHVETPANRWLRKTGWTHYTLPYPKPPEEGK